MPYIVAALGEMTQKKSLVGQRDDDDVTDVTDDWVETLEFESTLQQAIGAKLVLRLHDKYGGLGELSAKVDELRDVDVASVVAQPISPQCWLSYNLEWVPSLPRAPRLRVSSSGLQRLTRCVDVPAGDMSGKAQAARPTGQPGSPSATWLDARPAGERPPAIATAAGKGDPPRTPPRSRGGPSLAMSPLSPGEQPQCNRHVTVM